MSSNLVPEDYDKYFKEVAKRTGQPYYIVKAVIDDIFLELRKEFKTPSKASTLITKFGSFSAVRKNVIAEVKRRKKYRTEEENEFWNNYIEILNNYQNDFKKQPNRSPKNYRKEAGSDEN